METVFRRQVAVQYDGANKAEVLRVVREQSITRSMWSVKSESANGLVLHERNQASTLEKDWTVPLNSWVVMAPDFGLKDILSDAMFQARYGNLDGTIDDTKATIIAATQAYVDATKVPGPKGDKGDRGLQGERGLQGVAGTNGKDAVVGFPCIKSVAVPAIALFSGTREVVVTWPRTLPNTNYGVDVAEDATVIGKYTYAVKANSKTTTGFTLLVTNTTLLTVALGVVHVQAYSL
ncbi:collagen-like protein [Actinoplanes sp. NPDC049596]|uniref:collagen-like triple helix repeat-containing protein n=1 Tax=unclassified Actinoplanes TaxID=2626549 RepID=UPI0034139FC9